MKRNRFVLMNVDGATGGAGGAGGGEASGTLPGGTGSTPGGDASSASWYAGFSTPELRGTVENKGWKSAEDAVRGYSELEKVIGTPKDYLLTLPQKDDDVEGWNKVYQRLGRPEKADDYGLTKLEGADPKFTDMMSKAFYESGAPKKVVDRVMQDYQAYAKQYFEGQESQGKLAAEADTAKLKAEWGDQYQGTLERGGQALKELWGDKADEAMAALQSKLGVYESAKLVAKLADKAGEATFRQSGEGTGGNSGFGFSPDGAKAEIAKLKASPDFARDLLGDNPQAAKAARNKLSKLMQIAYPGAVDSGAVGSSATR